MLSDVSRSSSCNAWAVGLFEKGPSSQTLVERWDGTKWRHVWSPSPGGRSRYDRLTGVKAFSARNVWAVGSYSNGTAPQTLIEHWNGSRWKVVRSPNPGGANWPDRLTAVDASSRRNIWAVGSFRRHGRTRTLIVRRTERGWVRVPSPTPGPADAVNQLHGVAVLSESDVWAVGLTRTEQGDYTLTLHWDGSEWSVVSSPNPSASVNGLNQVAGSSSSDVWAVGYYLTPSPELERRAIVLHWDGDHWSSEAGPDVAGPDHSVVLTGVDAGATAAWAVGYSGCCTEHALIAKRDSSGWQVLASPDPGSGSLFKAVDVNSSGIGWAAGYYFNGTTFRAFIGECC